MATYRANVITAEELNALVEAAKAFPTKKDVTRQKYESAISALTSVIPMDPPSPDWCKTYKDFTLNLMQLSLFLCWDIEDLEASVRDLRADLLYDALNNVEPLIKNVMANTSVPARAFRSGAATTDDYASPPPPPGQPQADQPPAKKKSRKRASVDADAGPSESKTPTSKGKAVAPQEKKDKQAQTSDLVARVSKGITRATARDGGLCIFLGSQCPELCHIVPYSMNASEDSATNIRKILCKVAFAMSPHLQARWEMHLCPLDENGRVIPGASHSAANIFSMNRHLHEYWGKAIFYVEWVDQDDEPVPDHEAPFLLDDDKNRVKFTRYRLRWHWLPSGISKRLAETCKPAPKRYTHKGNAAKLVMVETLEERARIEAALNERLPQTHTAAYDDPHRKVEDGHIIPTLAETSAIETTKTMVQVQEVFVKMASVSGAADVLDQLDGEYRPGPGDETSVLTRKVSRLSRLTSKLSFKSKRPMEKATESGKKQAGETQGLLTRSSSVLRSILGERPAPNV
ncbi:hypothetical protein F5X68DRAFT_237328 [Plectosphaerella plurivora]|uniref:HNH nuclease domain-containing protein n=1 Tax=Plectosphaerella plurivora TaxID=936078 RepID=A0A9P8V0N2_9PEZI|nr:hypothetical protein F5X68DRAFT_237328 [Plectosphaerella plurivora]